MSQDSNPDLLVPGLIFFELLVLPRLRSVSPDSLESSIWFRRGVSSERIEGGK